MSAGTWIAVIAASAALLTVLLALRAAPQHWSLRGPARNARDARDLFRWVNARDRHARTLRRLVAVGPFTIYVMRYGPGRVEEDAP